MNSLESIDHSTHCLAVFLPQIIAVHGESGSLHQLSALIWIIESWLQLSFQFLDRWAVSELLQSWIEWEGINCRNASPFVDNLINQLAVDQQAHRTTNPRIAVGLKLGVDPE